MKPKNRFNTLAAITPAVAIVLMFGAGDLSAANRRDDSLRESGCGGA